MSRFLTVVIILALSVLASCAAPTPAAPPPATTVPRPIPSGELRITLRRSGGFAGRVENFVLNADGSILSGETTKQAIGGANAATQLAAKIDATKIFDLPSGKYLPANTCCDRYMYDLTLVRGDQAYNYITIEGEATTPRALIETITLIERYVAAAR
jgi:hypothetical protein